ncbi:MAG: tRNA lysidine(34) synthetase TilS [Thermoleophilaceae bacterium]|nr:tRNA lysidine(34) synthetase TilS [Thermoleophilaceae bacterium]
MERPLEAARASGLVGEGEPLLVMLSGGGDSVCLLDVCVRLGARVSALHVNYGLREGAGEDEASCGELCSRLGAPLVVEPVSLAGAGNLQARARDARYAAAEHHAVGDYAAGHTASDQAETVLYRLATSPGRRALLGMEPRRERLVRPLLEVTREEVRSYLRHRSLDWREDPSNADRRFARARAREELLPAFRSLSPAAERAVAETALVLRDEAKVIDRAVDEALSGLGGGPAVEARRVRELSPALARLVLRSLAERAAGCERPLSRAEADRLLALGRDGGSRSLDLGEGLRAVCEYGVLRFTRARESGAPAPAELPVPGRVRFGDWEVEAALGSPGEVTVREAERFTVRAWRDGDRMRPLGLGGSKSLQDLLTDRKVPRALRRSLPVVCAGDEVVWVAGVALDERWADAAGTVGLRARQVA